MGHIYVHGTTYQIADTPGLIYRPDAKRNAIEHLALAMMEKTQAVRPRAVGRCVSDQLHRSHSPHDLSTHAVDWLCV